MITEEITSQVRNEISSNIKAISTDRTTLFEKRTRTIHTYVQSENRKLQADIKNLQKGMLPKTIKQDEFINNFDNSKKFV